ncbi:hypothetical protein D9M71_589210 [compost metagenome]
MEILPKSTWPLPESDGVQAAGVMVPLMLTSVLLACAPALTKVSSAVRVHKRLVFIVRSFENE